MKVQRKVYCFYLVRLKMAEEICEKVLATSLSEKRITQFNNFRRSWPTLDFHVSHLHLYTLFFISVISAWLLLVLCIRGCHFYTA